MTNYELFRQTVNTLRSSQGFYSRLARDLEEMTQEDLSELKSRLNRITPKWSEPLDVIFYLEQ